MNAATVAGTTPFHIVILELEEKNAPYSHEDRVSYNISIRGQRRPHTRDSKSSVHPIRCGSGAWRSFLRVSSARVSEDNLNPIRAFVKRRLYYLAALSREHCCFSMLIAQPSG